jgi:hypothetical protein
MSIYRQLNVKELCIKYLFFEFIFKGLVCIITNEKTLFL